jgi:hypothetical protein
MVLFCALWTLIFYLFWLTIRPGNGVSWPFWALLTGGASALVRFFIPTLVDVYGFGTSRFASAFIDYISLPVLFPFVAALLISRFYRRSGITDFTGFVLLAMTPVSFVYSISWGARHEVLRLVLTPLLWTALAVGFYPFIRLFNGKLFHKTAAILGMAALLLLTPLVWLDLFRHNYIEGAALLLAALAPMLVSSVLFSGKKRRVEGLNMLQTMRITKTSDRKFVYALRLAALGVWAFVKKTQKAAAVIGVLLLCLAAAADYFVSGLARRTFVFQLIDTGQDIVEERMLMRTGSREVDIYRYLEEVILGPLSLEAEPILNRGTRLEAVMLRDGNVFIDFSEEAAIPPTTGSLMDKFRGLRADIRRNFFFVKDIRIFITGQETMFF